MEPLTGPDQRFVAFSGKGFRLGTSAEGHEIVTTGGELYATQSPAHESECEEAQPFMPDARAVVRCPPPPRTLKLNTVRGQPCPSVGGHRGHRHS